MPDMDCGQRLKLQEGAPATKRETDISLEIKCV